MVIKPKRYLIKSEWSCLANVGSLTWISTASSSHTVLEFLPQAISTNQNFISRGLAWSHVACLHAQKGDAAWGQSLGPSKDHFFYTNPTLCCLPASHPQDGSAQKWNKNMERSAPHAFHDDSRAFGGPGLENLGHAEQPKQEETTQNHQNPLNK